MNTSKRFNNAITALVRAFFNGTLAKGSCSACAVGNMIAFGMGKQIDLDKYNYWKDGTRVTWDNIFCTSGANQYFFSDSYIGEAKAQVDSTGYNPYELARVEKAFEGNSKIKIYEYPEHTQSEIMQDQFNGLMAVVGVLMEIEGIDKTVNDYRKPFEYTDDFKPVIPVVNYRKERERV
jgi:hypothetical protein